MGGGSSNGSSPSLSFQSDTEKWKTVFSKLFSPEWKGKRFSELFSPEWKEKWFSVLSVQYWNQKRFPNSSVQNGRENDLALKIQDWNHSALEIRDWKHLALEIQN
ncbi:hypothetical protein C1645_880788 [Glomus cerebriforme]|uniref:Uncharacterized protein n=1 Tax=Glomus cerebriforme TaxID=658196 RepID=A0A397SDY3_9GLOM|nr:hypothetical protein C1645_880788 [Glomus cerebriforme]